MELYYEGTHCKLYTGDMAGLLDVIEPNSIDSVVTDPITNLAFQAEAWEKCYAVLKPGGHLLVFSDFNKYRRLACVIEDSGFEIRDSLLWLFGSSLGSIPNALKPYYESIILARKPCEGACVDNVLKYGVGGLNIDDCRVPFVNSTDYKITADKNQHEKFGTPPMTDNRVYGDYSMIQPKNYQSEGRFPSNVILTYTSDDYDEVCGGMPYTESNGGTPTMPDLRDVGVKSKAAIGIDKLSFGQVRNADRKTQSYYVAPADSGNASRYFLCAKLSDKDQREDQTFVKPCELIQYLVRLITPPDGVIMDPFNYLGDTGVATMYENQEHNSNFTYIGVDPVPDNLRISADRINAVLPK